MYKGTLDQTTTVKFGVTRHRVTLDVHPGRYIAGEPTPGPGLAEARWLTPDEVDDLSRSSATRRVLARLHDLSCEGQPKPRYTQRLAADTKDDGK